MNIFLKKLMVSSLMLMGIHANLYASTPDSDLKDVLQKITTIQGMFHQKVLTEQGKLLQESNGLMWLKKPGKFRWEVQGNDQRIVVADGQKVWDYDKDLEQVTIQTISQGQTVAPIFFLTGDIHSVSRDFLVSKIKLSANAGCMSGSNQCFELKPKAKQGSFQWIRIGFTGENLKELELLDQLGQHSVFVFEKILSNASIPDKQFQFIPPQGVDIVSH
jgi:outer membrane lipoprotein carrier protein